MWLVLPQYQQLNIPVTGPLASCQIQCRQLVLLTSSLEILFVSFFNFMRCFTSRFYLVCARELFSLLLLLLSLFE